MIQHLEHVLELIITNGQHKVRHVLVVRAASALKYSCSKLSRAVNDLGLSQCSYAVR